MKKSIQIGISDFKKLIEGNNYFIDKSMIIKEFIENSADIILTPRPRRFGKMKNIDDDLVFGGNNKTNIV